MVLFRTMAHWRARYEAEAIISSMYLWWCVDVGLQFRKIVQFNKTPTEFHPEWAVASSLIAALSSKWPWRCYLLKLWSGMLVLCARWQLDTSLFGFFPVSFPKNAFVRKIAHPFEPVIRYWCCWEPQPAPALSLQSLVVWFPFPIASLFWVFHWILLIRGIGDKSRTCVFIFLWYLFGFAGFGYINCFTLVWTY